MKRRDANGKFIRTQPDRKCATCFTWFYSPDTVATYCSQPCYWEMKRIRRDRVLLSEDGRKRIQASKLGERNHQWRGGVTPGRVKLRNTMEYKAWRKAVYERDNYTCVKCERRGGELNADHIIPWWMDPSRSFDVNNGQTLCESCHRSKTSAEQSVCWVNQYGDRRLS